MARPHWSALRFPTPRNKPSGRAALIILLNRFVESVVRSAKLILMLSAVLVLSACETSAPGRPSGPQPQAQPSAKAVDQDKLFRHCNAMSVLGRYIGQARLQGMNTKQAARRAASRFLARDGRRGNQDLIVSSAAIFAVLVYRLDRFKPETVSAYVLTACLTIRGRGLYIPTDAGYERAMNALLRRCQREAVDMDGLGACVIEGTGPLSRSFKPMR